MNILIIDDLDGGKTKAHAFEDESLLNEFIDQIRPGELRDSIRQGDLAYDSENKKIYYLFRNAMLTTRFRIEGDTVFAKI